jgi:hypothetical protein
MCTGDFVEVYSEESQECKITHFSYKWDFLLNKAGTKMIWNFGGPLSYDAHIWTDCGAHIFHLHNWVGVFLKDYSTFFIDQESF